MATPSPSTSLLRLYDICSHFELLDYYVPKPHSTFQFSPPNDACANSPTHPVPSVCASSQSLLQLPQEPHFGSSSTNTETPPGYTKQTDVWRNRLSKFFCGSNRQGISPTWWVLPSTREIHRLSGNWPSPKLPPPPPSILSPQCFFWTPQPPSRHLACDPLFHCISPTPYKTYQKHLQHL